MLKTQTYKIISCDDRELNIKRTEKLEFKLDYDDEKNIEALLFFIAGGAASIENYEYVAAYAARNYNVACVRVRYHCIDNRPQLGCSFYMDDTDKSIMENSLRFIGLNFDKQSIDSFESMNAAFIRIDNILNELKQADVLLKEFRLPLHVSFNPLRNEYQNFGLMQAQDIISALLQIKKPLTLNTKNGGGGYKNYIIRRFLWGLFSKFKCEIITMEYRCTYRYSRFCKFVWRHLAFNWIWQGN